MSHHPWRMGQVLWLLIAGILTAVGFVAWSNREPSRPPRTDNPFTLPPYSESRYLNTGSETDYIGTAACAGCHSRNHQSFLLTEHSRSLAEVDPKVEPPDGSFDHTLSGRSYRVFRRDNQLHHEEILRTASGKQVTRVDVPVRYRIGSGHFTRTYLVELDGFLHQSPITWYASKKQWDMSPGYDFPKHWGFDRPILANCVTCHAGRAEATDGTLHRIVFHEQVIGCENCHGPGSRHKEFQQQNPGQIPGAEDLTIVNPARLSRPRLEAVCGTCHLSGPATIALRGRRPSDFRPGMPLTDYRVDYRFEGGKELMTVSGHLAQLRKSTCYQHSEELTCLTCHDPHAQEKPSSPAAFYRQKCLSCHTVDACGLTPVERRAKDATDNCLACHMPRGDTEMPHLAFTNHRIERRPTLRSADLKPGGALLLDSSRRVPELVPVDDVPQLAPLDQRRNLGLAYFAACRQPVYTRYGYADAFRERARDLLQGVDAAGLPDPETAVALAELSWEKEDRDSATAYARQALQAPDISTEGRVSSLLILAGAAMRNQEFEEASRWLEEVVPRQRAANDWYFLGLCYLELDQPSRALPALRQSLLIRPDSSAVHARLAQVYRRLRNVALANEHEEKARWLFKEHED